MFVHIFEWPKHFASIQRSSRVFSNLSFPTIFLFRREKVTETLEGRICVLFLIQCLKCSMCSVNIFVKLN